MMLESTQQRLQNLYIARLVTQERPCFVCNKFTGVVLTSADNSNADWFYICKSHLGDSNFCSKLGGSPKTTRNSQQREIKKKELANRPPESDSVIELVSSIGSALKSWTTKKTKEEGNDKKEKEGKKEDEETKSDKADNDEEKSLNSSNSTIHSSSPKISNNLPQQPVRFVIQRDYFYLRQREYQKKIQKKEAAEKLKTLQFPEVPKAMPTLQK
ncbi:VPS4-associated protein 1 [Cokeromyces recurvatus]|uniref:VPS4-associated protein 1 n=1 Tax=Cokeromyces recurvatus TaxID=90255 RepID=UPI002220348F|nr:VPS4-associated protein 1 [Cokeromyces recurvatus]KAI7903745.1 VPS4-associated protein 1 [Cokeromyces recurvatus]